MQYRATAHVRVTVIVTVKGESEGEGRRGKGGAEGVVLCALVMLLTIWDYIGIFLFTASCIQTTFLYQFLNNSH